MYAEAGISRRKSAIARLTFASGSVPKVPLPGEHHRHSQPIGGSDGFLVAQRTARLNACGDTCGGWNLDPVPRRGRKRRTPSPRRSTGRRRGVQPGRPSPRDSSAPRLRLPSPCLEQRRWRWILRVWPPATRTPASAARPRWAAAGDHLPHRLVTRHGHRVSAPADRQRRERSQSVGATVALFLRPIITRQFFLCSASHASASGV